MLTHSTVNDTALGQLQISIQYVLLRFYIAESQCYILLEQPEY